MIDIRSAFVAAGHDVSGSSFARAMLRATQAATAREFDRVGLLSVAAAAVFEVQIPNDAGAPKGRPIAAYANAGRWLAKCECGGAEYVDFDELAFMCCGCWNAVDGHEWRPITLPGDEVLGDAVAATFTREMLSVVDAGGEVVAAVSPRARIEALLLARADPSTRNWKPGETLDDLATENVAHGVVS